MTVKLKWKTNSKRRRLKWAILPLLLLFLVMWYQHGLVPSSDTLALRRQLAGTTRVVVTYHTSRDYKVEPKTFTLQGQEARDFAHSILLSSRNRYLVSGRIVSMVVSGCEAGCTFYKGSKVLASLQFFARRDSALVSGATAQGIPELYPSSSRHIFRLFEERSHGTAIKH